MDELYRIVQEGEQCLSWDHFQLAVKECRVQGATPAAGVLEEVEGMEGEEGVAAGVRASAEVPATVNQLQPSTAPGFLGGGQVGAGEVQLVQVTLENKDLWKQFSKITNEMIVTKAGRRMFPLLQVSLTGLVSTASYIILLEFRIINDHRWRFLNGDWQATSASASTEPPEQRCVYIHPSSPQTGAQWMKEKITFSKLKLSNKEDGKGKVKLYSLYRYQPCLHVIRLASTPPIDLQGQEPIAFRPLSCTLSTYIFVETQFIAVTAYQNDKITQMKIKHNPYAKAFQGPQDSLHFSRTSTDVLVSTTHFHHQQPHLPSPTLMTTPTHQAQATPNHHSLLAHGSHWMSHTQSGPQYAYHDAYHPQYHNQPQTPSYYPHHHQQHHHQQPLGVGAPPPQAMSVGHAHWGLPPTKVVSGGQQQQQQVWFGVSGDGPVQALNSQASPL